MVDDVIKNFQEGNWDEPGWELAKKVMELLLDPSVNSKELNPNIKIYIVELSLKAATASSVWLEFLISVAHFLCQKD